MGNGGLNSLKGPSPGPSVASGCGRLRPITQPAADTAQLVVSEDPVPPLEGRK